MTAGKGPEDTRSPDFAARRANWPKPAIRCDDCGEKMIPSPNQALMECYGCVKFKRMDGTECGS